MHRLFTTTLSCLIIFELMMTGLGFCGHCHTHIDTLCDGYFHNDDVHEDHHHEHESDRCHCSESQESRTDYHCPCLGGFVGESQMICIEFSFCSELYFPPKPDRYTFVWSPLIFHPPQPAV